MAKEGDQTKWVGIRPTDPSEDIPTTTRKVAPAVADLQAFKERYRLNYKWLNRNCSVSFNFTTVATTAGEVNIINHVSIMNGTSLCDMEIAVRHNATYLFLAGFYSIEPGIMKSWAGKLVLEEGARVYGYWLLGGANDDITLNIAGYKVGVY